LLASCAASAEKFFENSDGPLALSPLKYWHKDDEIVHGAVFICSPTKSVAKFLSAQTELGEKEGILMLPVAPATRRERVMPLLPCLPYTKKRAYMRTCAREHKKIEVAMISAGVERQVAVQIFLHQKNRREM